MLNFLWALIRWFFCIFIVTPAMLVFTAVMWIFGEKYLADITWQSILDTIWYDMP